MSGSMCATRTAVVTGAASGIGHAAAVRLARDGWRVVLADRNEPAGRQAAADLAAEGAQTTFTGLDVANDEAVETFADDVFRTGRVDAVVHAAGILENAVRLTAMPMSEYDEILSVNLRGSVLVGRAFGKGLANQGSGSFVHLCSMTALRPGPQPAYALSKAGIKMLTEIMAAELGPRGVRVNAVIPGYTMSPAMRERIASGQRDPRLVIERSALGRFVEPEDVADAIAFLCSDAARAITGIMLPVDCGWLASAAYTAYATRPDE